MPQLNAKQRGSILVTVVGISALLGTAVASYMALSGRGADAGTDAVWRQRTFLAAESGLILGLRYMRGIDYTKWTESNTWGVGVPLTQSASGTAGWMEIDGIFVKVMLDHDFLHRKVISYATRGAGSDTVKLTVEANATQSAAASFQTDLATDRWKMAILP